MAQKAKKKTPSKTVKTAAAKPVAKTTTPKAVKKSAPKKTAAKKSTAKKAAPKKAVAQTVAQKPAQAPTGRKGISPVHEAKKQKNYFMLALIVAVIVGLFALTVVKVGG